MAEKDIIQNMIHDLGQSQIERSSKALDVHYANVDERTTVDLLLFTKRFAKLVNFYLNTINSPSGDWTNFFDYDEDEIKKLLEGKNGTTPPHLALFITFLELYKKPQEITNRITGRHLDFYYKEVLRLTKKPAIPDKAHLLIELKNNATPISIVPDKDLFLAGKDKKGVELLYNPTTETVINASNISSLRSIYMDDIGHGLVRYAPIANSSDGLGGNLPEDNPKWYGFGHPGLSPAETGFAIASPVLRMQEGLRKIKLTLTVENIDATKVNDRTLAGSFDAFITGVENWLGPYSVSPTVKDGNKLLFEFEVPKGEKAVVDYDSAIHGYSYSAQMPIVQILLKSDPGIIGIKDFDHITVVKASVSVDVSDIRSLRLESDAGAVDPTKAFLPFGSQPTRGSRFMVGYEEALSKKLSEISITVEWKDAPINFNSHYSGYDVTVNNNYFTASIAFKDAGSWDYTGTGHNLFQSSNPTAEKTFTFYPGISSVSANITQGMKIYELSQVGTSWAYGLSNRFSLKMPIFMLFKSVAPKPKQGFIIFSLEKSFLHSNYRKKYVENVMTYSKTGTSLTILNEPYTPTIQNISLSYKAHSDDVNISSSLLDDFANLDLRFFHIAYFGQMREHGYQREQFDFLLNKKVTLVPRYDHKGELLIGISNLNPRDSVSILFQVGEGSANPDADQEKINWFVLCDNYWKRMDKNEVVLDSTNQLLTSGVIKFVIPKEATITNSIMPTGMIWLKAGVEKDVTALCQLIQVSANAVEVQFRDQGNDSENLLTALEPGKITKLKNGLSEIKAVNQPYASFGGRPQEEDKTFYTRVSERLRHKNRCITAWDYERIILEGFPKVHKVKCIPHSSQGSWLAPGHVLIVVIADLKNKNAIDPLEPKVDANTISRITSHVQARTGLQIKVKVRNPRYQKIQLDFKVKFRTGYEFNYYSETLKQQLIRFISPWAFDTGRDLTFGGKIYKSVLLDFVEDLKYVDYVTDFKMYSYVGDAINYSDLNEVRPESPDTILVSEKTHLISEAV